MSRVDVSVVLNMHREALFLAPTLRSLAHCAAAARDAGIAVELIAVFDRADEPTREVFRSHDLSAFLRVEEVHVDVGSLGLARNAGIASAQGEFIWTSDADDLVSSNAIVALVDTARRHPHPRVVVFLEYLCAFGDQYHNVRYVGSEYLTPADFAYQHSYVSRIFVRRAVFDLIKYDDLRLTSGFAYEDWHFNCELRAMGCDMLIAPDTVLFYRQRSGSLLRQANAASSRLIPHNKLFERGAFLTDMRQCRERVGDWGDFMRARKRVFDADNTQGFMRSERLQAFLREAVRLEPAIEPGRVETAGSYSPIPGHADHWGAQMESLYRMLGGDGFTDVVFLPWLRPGGAEKYILQMINEIAVQEEGARFLVIAGEAADRHEWVGELPRCAVFIDLYNTFPSLGDADRDAMLMRTLLATCKPDARVHIKSSVFAHRMLAAYAPVLSANYRTVYYRFCDDTYEWKGASLRSPWGIDVMRHHLPGFWKVVSDCNAIVEADHAVLGAFKSKYETIYAACNSLSGTTRPQEPTYRLLWASRISQQKRPDLVGEIAHALHAAGMNIEIDVFGAPDDGMEPYEALGGKTAGVKYRGGFSRFAELPVENYDALLYTSAFDGLPNILLEALSVGLPVIAPDVGGVGEAVVNGVTGMLVGVDDDRAVIVERYVMAVKSLYGDWEATRRMSGSAKDLIERRHGADMFASRVAEVFHLGGDAVAEAA